MRITTLENNILSPIELQLQNEINTFSQIKIQLLN